MDSLALNSAQQQYHRQPAARTRLTKTLLDANIVRVPKPPAEMTDDELGTYLADGVVGIVRRASELKPYFEEWWHRFDAGHTILGCRTRTEFCDRVLHLSIRAVQYHIYGRSPKKTAETETDEQSMRRKARASIAALKRVIDDPAVTDVKRHPELNNNKGLQGACEIEVKRLERALTDDKLLFRIYGKDKDIDPSISQRPHFLEPLYSRLNKLYRSCHEGDVAKAESLIEKARQQFESNVQELLETARKVAIGQKEDLGHEKPEA